MQHREMEKLIEWVGVRLWDGKGLGSSFRLRRLVIRAAFACRASVKALRGATSAEGKTGGGWLRHSVMRPLTTAGEIRGLWGS